MRGDERGGGGGGIVQKAEIISGLGLRHLGSGMMCHDLYQGKTTLTMLHKVFLTSECVNEVFTVNLRHA